MKKSVLIFLFFVFFIFLSVNCIVEAKSNENNNYENEVYEIETYLNSDMVLDVSEASILSGANIQIWEKCNGRQQRFKLQASGDGYYFIKNVKSGKYLDVKNAGTDNKTNVQQWNGNKTDAQKWKIVENNDGTACFVSKCNGLYLSVHNSGKSNGTNIEVDKKGEQKNQKFNLKRIETIRGKKSIKDGVYKICTVLDKNKVLDISKGSTASGANVQIWNDSNVLQQKFIITADQDGYYSIRSLKSRKVLDVSGGETEKYTNVQQWESNSTDAQKWIIEENDGYYRIISKVAGINLEVENGKTNNGTNIRINYDNNSKNQKFNLIEIDEETKTIDDGIYEITTSLASNMIVDVSGGSNKDGANVQIWADANENQQKFKFEYVSSGNYKIICKRSGKSLTVSTEENEYSSNVYQSTYTGTNNQLWKIKKAEDKKYYIISKYNERYLDVSGAHTTNGTNITVYNPNNTNAQKFVLEQKKYGIDVSHWQGTIDFQKVKNTDRVDFMIIRAGHGITIKDKKFEYNYSEAKKYNIPIGVYLYATAQNVEEAEAEANYCLKLISGKNFELPIFYDVEAQENLDKPTITNICNAFYKKIKNAGYNPGIYASKYYLLYKIDVNKLPVNCKIWVASYGKNDGTVPKDTYRYNENFDIWQFTSTGKIDGIDGDVDFDLKY